MNEKSLEVINPQALKRILLLLQFLCETTVLFHRIILLEQCHALFQLVVLMVFDERCAYAQAFLMGARGDKTDG